MLCARLKVHRLSFNSCPREGATLYLSHGIHMPSVSIHAPAKGQPFIPVFRQFPFKVSIHAPAKGQRDCNIHFRSGFLFQFMPPRRGNFHFHHKNQLKQLVSIHAPAKGQPSRIKISISLPSVSIHAPAKGQPSMPFHRGIPINGFNSCPREGATIHAFPSWHSNKRFQFMPPRRGNQILMKNILPFLRFQFMPPRRGNYRAKV